MEENEKKISYGKDGFDEKVGRNEIFMQESNAGMGTVEIILIIVVLIGLVIIFKGQITELVNDIFDKITSQAGKV